jgi:hypothetical protein
MRIFILTFKNFYMKSFCIAFLLLLPFASSAQLFERTYLIPNVSGGSPLHIYDTINGTYLLFGNGIANLPATLVKINKYGDTLWTRKTMRYANQTFHAETFIKTNSGNLLVFGYCWSNSVANNMLYKVVIQKYNSSGNYLSADSIPIDINP